MNWTHSLSILPLLAAAQQAAAEAVALPAAAVAASAPVTVSLPSSFGMVIWAPILVALVAMVGTLVFLISRQGRTPVARPRTIVLKPAKTRPTRAPALARP
ncbi:MAG TPA: hypothetical protein VJM11_16260 [Nevskiaceae bacterium]|nr:hypothetical protein [Nevskiaceae bacterium]